MNFYAWFALKANYCVFVSVQNAIPNDDGRVWMMVLPSRFKFHAALLSFPHEYSFQITHTACLMPMVMETTISCKLKPYEEEKKKKGEARTRMITTEAPIYLIFRSQYINIEETSSQ